MRLYVLLLSIGACLGFAVRASFFILECFQSSSDHLNLLHPWLAIIAAVLLGLLTVLVTYKPYLASLPRIKFTAIKDYDIRWGSDLLMLKIQNLSLSSCQISSIKILDKQSELFDLLGVYKSAKTSRQLSEPLDRVGQTLDLDFSFSFLPHHPNYHRFKKCNPSHLVIQISIADHSFTQPFPADLYKSLVSS